MKLLIVLPLTAADLPLASSLLSHIHRLGPCSNAILFVADHGMAKDQYGPLMDAAKPTFPAGGILIHTPLALPDLSYPIGHNFRFETAARHIGEGPRVPFLWLDPRSTPTRRTWLRELEEEYLARRKPFLGHVLTPASHGTSQPLLASTAIYPSPLPKRMLQRLVAMRNTDFERTCADLVVPEAYASSLIYSMLGSTAKPPPVAALVHAAKPRAFRLEPAAPNLLGRSDAPADKSPTSPTPPPRATSYYHSGNLGDIIYALAAIRLAGGGRLLLGPTQRRTSPCDKPLKEPAFELLAPLLTAQPYLSKVSYTPRHPGTDAAFDLNSFRDQWNDRPFRARTNIHSLVGMHCHVLGVLEKFRHEEPWLTAPSSITTPYFTIHRSPRYRAEGDAAFPWAMVLKHFHGRLLYVGLLSEHTEFQRAFTTRLPFWHCADFLDLARVVAGAHGHIGNQSFPMALALALGQRVLQESWPPSPDCVLARPSFLTQPFAAGQLAVWEASPRPLK